MNDNSSHNMRSVIPDRILEMPEAEQIDKIREHKARLGNKLVILGHHYQRESIIGVSDFIGDSFGLSAKAASQKDAQFIVFCGVHFMAESARVLAKPHQRVFQPNLDAGCPMADMADIDEVEAAWQAVEKVLGPGRVVPITYMNSTVDVKAFCGGHGGAVCTSSNAKRVFEWAIAQGKKVFFLPDEHLGRNTSNSLAIPKKHQLLWDRQARMGGHTARNIEQAHVILWDGFCHVHTYYTVNHLEQIKQAYPAGKIVVHPECREEVVAKADAVGSTGFICTYVKEAPAGSVILIATEINLTIRLARENADKTILPVARSLCPNMYKINPANLLSTLDSLGKENEIVLDADVSRLAKLALDKML
ncbi:MAG: quinolinate synthase NadA, partial [Candidatus Latescibacterota bacterium]